MFGLLNSSDRKARQNRTPRLARPRLETLEGREVPATLTLNVSYSTGMNVTLYGTLSDHSSPSMQTINITGKVQGATMTNAQGEFSIPTTATGVGEVSATVADSSSNTPTVNLTDAAISLTFVAVEGTDRLWTLSGDVTYSRGPQNLMICFGGAPASLQTLMTSTDSEGHYETGVYLNGTSTDNGAATAYVKSPWETNSEVAIDLIHQTGT